MTQIEGPFSFKEADGLKLPVYIYKPGAIKKIVGEVSVKVSGGMTFAVNLDEEHKDIETASFDVPMRYTYLNLPDKPKIDWGYNCLTLGVHHGHPGQLWNTPLMQALQIFKISELADLTITRIYNDAMQYVEHGNNPRYNQTWADQTKVYAEDQFPHVFHQKIGELHTYYTSAQWHKECQNVVQWVKEDKLNPGYKPLHSHDSINMLCRILGTQCAREASRDTLN